MEVSNPQAAAVANEIAHLRGLDCGAAAWRSLTVARRRPVCPRTLLLQVLAYRVQAAAFGDLDAATIRLLDRLASEGRSSTRVVPVPDRIGLRPGTVLVRAWEDRSDA